MKKILLTIFSSFLIYLAEAQNKSAASKPNIIYIVADDLGYGDLGCFGSKHIKTPTLDQMAAEGLKLTRHYSTAVCAPSRAAIMTGKHMGHCEIRGNKQDINRGNIGQYPLSDTAVTIASLLQKAGYSTAMIGKWGLGEPETSGDPARKGFDLYYGYTDQVLAHNQFPEYLIHNGQKEYLPNEVVYLDSTQWHKGRASLTSKKMVWSQERFSEKVNQFITENKTKPFFIYYTPVIPHINDEAPKGELMESITMEPYTKEEKWTDDMKRYAASITYLDNDIKKLLEHLKKEGLDKNTLVIFVSDNGPINPSYAPELKTFNSTANLRGYKRDMYEGGIRVPFIAYGSMVKAGTSDATPTALWDFFPTACELAGINYTGHTDGVSLVPLFQGKKIKPRPYLYFELFEFETKQALIMGDWKAVRNSITASKPNPPLELYNLKNDPKETTDVSAKNPKIVAQMDKLMREARIPSALFKLPGE